MADASDTWRHIGQIDPFALSDGYALDAMPSIAKQPSCVDFATAIGS
jgi:hypothetical protein